MIAIRVTAAATLCVLVAAEASAQKAAPDAGAQQPAAAAGPAGWSAEDIALARARCTFLLKGLNVVAVPEPPLREGAECGTPAPMKLITVGRNPEVALSPPPTVTCDLIAAIAKWVEADLQPLARKHLGAPVIRIDTMSSYSCRNAYGRVTARLSEHGRANAVDIAGFVTAHGQSALVLADWGPTARDIAQAAAAAAAEKATAAAKAATPQAQASELQTSAQPRQPAALSLTPAATTAASALGPSLRLPLRGTVVEPKPGFAGDASRLGGPKPRSAPSRAAGPVPLGGRTSFLRGIHLSACKTFGTVLGPEANDAHKNHFHLDMAERPVKRICE